MNENPTQWIELKEDFDPRHRWFDCERYNKCLDIAREWESWTCWFCPKQEKERKRGEE